MYNTTIMFLLPIKPSFHSCGTWLACASARTQTSGQTSSLCCSLPNRCTCGPPAPEHNVCSKPLLCSFSQTTRRKRCLVLQKSVCLTRISTGGNYGETCTSGLWCFRHPNTHLFSVVDDVKRCISGVALVESGVYETTLVHVGGDRIYLV